MSLFQKKPPVESFPEMRPGLNGISSKNGMARIVFSVKICVAAALIWLLVERINYAEFAAAFYNMDWRFFMAAILLMPFNIYGQIVKWRFLLKHLKKGITWKECALSLLAGITLGFVTPGRLGEFGRAFFVEDVPRSYVAVLVLIEKLISAIIIGFLGTWSLYTLVRLGYFTGGEKLWFSTAILFSLTIFGLLFFSKKTLNVIITIYRYLIKKDEHDSQAKSVLQQINPLMIPKYFGYGFLYYGIVVTQFYLFLRAFEFFPVMLGYIMVFAIMAAKSVLPISLGDLGAREATAIYFVTSVGGQDTSAFNAAILIFFINLAIPALVGLVILLLRQPNFLFSKFAQKKAAQI